MTHAKAFGIYYGFKNCYFLLISRTSIFYRHTRLQKHLELMAELIKHLTNSVLNKILQNKRQSYK